MLGYTDRASVEGMLNRTFPELSDVQFNSYISMSESYINNYLGYNSATTLSGMLSENVSNERTEGHVDSFNNLVVTLRKPPIHFDATDAPIVTSFRFEVGVVRVPLTLTIAGAALGPSSPFEVMENRRTLIYPSLYFLPAISTVTPTAKVALFNIASVRFWTVISYTGGYDTIPDDVKMASNFIVADLLTYRDNPQFLSSFSQGTVSKSFSGRVNDSKGFKLGYGMQMAQALLQPYVRVTW